MKLEHETVFDRTARLARESEPVICSICKQVADRPDLRGTMWRKSPDGIQISFSATVVQMAGGLEKLLAEWECVP